MAAKDGAEKSAGDSPVDFGALAAAVRAEVSRPKAAAPPTATIAAALARRAGGEAYAAIGRDLTDTLGVGAGEAAKAASLWCRTAERLDSGYSAGSKPRKPSEGPGKSRPVAVRLMPEDYRRLIEVADGMPVSAVVERAVRSYLRRSAPSQDQVMTGQRRKLLQDELSAIADALQTIQLQEQGVAKNFNQQTKFLNTYLELPLNHAREVARVNEVREALVGQLAGIRRSIDRLAEAG